MVHSMGGERGQPQGERSQWLRGVTELLVLGALVGGRSYGYELVERLTAAGLDDLNEATVYSALRRLESAGLLGSVVVAVTGGPARRYYELTATGRRRHRDAVARWHDFVGTVESVVGRPVGEERSA